MAETLAVVDMLDTIGATAGIIPKGTRRVAAYITGSAGVAWTDAQLAALAAKGVQLVVRIDQSNRVNALTSVKVLVKDIEPGASSNLTADHEAAQRARFKLRTTLYCMLSDFETLKNTVAGLGIASYVSYWIADWNLDRAGAIRFLEEHPEVVAVQWASPSSNPNTRVPESKLTLAQANVDLSVSRADWPTPAPAPRRKRRPGLPQRPETKVTAAALAGFLTTALLGYLNSHGAHITHLTSLETGAIDVAAAFIAAYVIPSTTRKTTS